MNTITANLSILWAIVIQTEEGEQKYEPFGKLDDLKQTLLNG